MWFLLHRVPQGCVVHYTGGGGGVGGGVGGQVGEEGPGDMSQLWRPIGCLYTVS